MADMNAGIILQGQTPDIMGNFSRGMDIRAQENALAQKNDLANLYRTQGAQILAGDQEALNALAGFDPNAALGVQQTRLGMDATRHGMQMDDQRMAMAQEELAMTKENARLRGAELKATMDANQAAQAAAAIDKAIAMGSQAQTPEQWDAVMGQLGEDGAQFVGQFENREMIIAGALGLSEALKMGPDPMDALDLEKRQLEIDALRNPTAEWRTATPEEAAANGAVAGQINTKTGKFDAQNPPQNFTVETSPDGSTRIVQGSGGPGNAKPTEGSLASEGYLQRMKGAEDIFSTLEAQGTVALGYTDRPAVDTAVEAWKLTEPEQMLLQAQRDWVRAKLRKESGAVIGPDEMASEIKQYFPQPGEGPKVAAQKKEARKRAEEQLRITAMLPPEAAAPQDGIPAVGDVVDGYKFKGGDPGNPDSWEPAQ